MVLRRYCSPTCDASEGEGLLRILALILGLARCQGWFMRPNKNAFTSWGFGQNLVCISSKCSTLGKQIRFDLILFERLLNSEDPYQGRLASRRAVSIALDSPYQMMVNAQYATIRPFSSTENYILSITDAMTESSRTSSTESTMRTAVSASNCF